MDVLPSSVHYRAQIRLLGPYRLQIGGQTRTQIINYDKARILLSMLALAHGKPLSRSRLAEIIWHEDPVSVGRARLRHALHALRRAFADCDEALLITNETLALDPSLIRIDVLELLQHPSQPALNDLERLDLYEGPLLEQVRIHHGEQLQDWLQDMQGQIRQTLAQCRDRYMGSELGQLPAAQAIAHVKRWLLIWPEEESLHQHLIGLLKQEGQHDAAMQAYEQCSVLLADRLGSEPNEHTRNLIKAVAPNLQQHVAPATTTPVLRQRPLAAVAFCLRFQAQGRHDREESGAILEKSRQALHVLTQKHGGWFSPAGPNQMLAYFGYPELLEAPIALAIHLARAAITLRLDERVRLSIALHADLSIDDHSGQPDAWGQLAQTVLPLSWQATPEMPLITRHALLRLAPEDVQVSPGNNDDTRSLNLHMNGSSPGKATSRVYGRSQEFDQLVQAWTQVGSARPLQHIAIYGRARIGKSLLVQSLADYVQKTDHPCVTLQCREDMRRQAWHPIRLWLHEQLADRIALQPAYQQNPFSAAAVQTALHLTAQQAHALSQWLQTPDDEQDLNEPSTAHMELLFSLLSGQPGPGRRRLLIIENMQWADPPTHKLIRQLAYATPRHPTLLLTTSRTPSHGLERAERMALRPLDRSSIGSLLSAPGRGQRLSRDHRTRLTRLSAGNPGHAQDLLRHLELGGAAECAPCLTDLVCTQYHSLLPATRCILTTIALTAAPIAIDELILMLNIDPDTLDSGLDTLVTLDLVERHAREVSCQPLVAQAVEQIALRHEQQQAHMVIAHHGIRRRYSPEIIAGHLCEADCADAALWWQRAAREALAKTQLRQAGEFLQRSLRRSELINDLQVRQTLQFECRMLQGAVETALYGPASASTAMAYELGRHVQDHQDHDQVMVSLWSNWTALQAQGNFTRSMQVARQLLSLASETGHDQNRSWALYAIGQQELWKGEVKAAEQTLLLSLAVLDELPPTKGRIAIASHYPQGLTLGTLAVTMALQGDALASLAYVRQALEHLRPDAMFTMNSINRLFVMQALYLNDQLEECLRMAEQNLKELKERSFPEPWTALARSYQYYCHIMLHGRTSDLQPLLNCVQIIQYGLPICANGVMARIARALVRLGRSSEAMYWLDKAAKLGAEHDNNSLSAELHCVRGDAWLAQGESSQALQQWNMAEQIVETYGLHLYTGWIGARRAALQRLKV